MTKFLTKSVLAATVALLATPALAVQAAPTPAAPAGESSFEAKAAIVKPVTLKNETALDFGSTTMLPSLTTAKVSVGNTATSVAVCSSTAMLACSNGAPARFLVSGPADETVQISIDNAPTKLLHSNGTNAVAFTVNKVSDVLLDGAGVGTFHVGGEITVQSSTIAGNYTATVNIDANYK